MTVRHRVRRLETRLRKESGRLYHVSAAAFDVPGEGDLQFQAGQWIPCPDRSAILADLKDLPLKLYGGFDPRAV
jgi:hypothetical protein